MDNQLTVIETFADHFTVVISNQIFDHLLYYRPSWIPINEYLELLIWISCLDDPNEQEMVTIQKTVDRIHEALKLCLVRSRIVNVDERVLVDGALGVMMRGFRGVTLRGNGLWRTLKMMISDGYRFKVVAHEPDGVYLTMFEI